MTNPALHSIPAPQRDSVRSALAAAFGSTPIDAIVPITGGDSGALPFRVQAGGRSVLLRLEGPASPLRNPHQYVSMRIAADAGIAPRIYHIDEEARIAVTDFIHERPLATYPGGPYALTRALGELVRRMHATTPFPTFVDYPDIVSRLWAHVCRTGLFAPGLLDPYTERLASLRQSCAWDQASAVSSHNDLTPSNILFDGERLWLIDWESAYRNDPLVDVAILLDNLAPSRGLEEVLLQAWFGRPPDQAHRARLIPIRALTRLYYAGVMFSGSATLPRARPDADLSAPTLARFRQAIRDGQLRPGTPETRHILGKMFLASFAAGAAPPGFDAAV